MKMPTLNVNVSKEALEKLKPLKKLGMGNFVSCAILDLSVERYLELLSDQVKTKKPKSNGKKKLA